LQMYAHGAERAMPRDEWRWRFDEPAQAGEGPAATGTDRTTIYNPVSGLRTIVRPCFALSLLKYS
jgi:hypothetical protein